MEISADDHALSAFVSARPRLFGIAYRMLGSAVEAEDIVQDAWLRWQSTDRSAVLDPTAFLVTTTTRLAINPLRSARSRRESYVGPWLPEPVDTSADPAPGSGTGGSPGVGRPGADGEALAYGTGRLRPPGSVRLSVSADRAGASAQ